MTGDRRLHQAVLHDGSPTRELWRLCGPRASIRVLQEMGGDQRCHGHECLSQAVPVS